MKRAALYMRVSTVDQSISTRKHNCTICVRWLPSVAIPSSTSTPTGSAARRRNGRAIIVIIGAIAELERNLIIERVRAGMRRARLEGRHIGRNPLELDHAGIQRDRGQGQSLREIAKGRRVSAATIWRVLNANTAQETKRSA